MSKTFINKSFKTRDYECTNIVACVADKAPNDNYAQVDDDAFLSNLTKLWVENGVEYYGHL